MTTYYTDSFYASLTPGSRSSASVVVPELIRLLRPSSVIDVGCGTGVWAAEFIGHGIERVLGVDGAYVPAQKREIDRRRFAVHDLSTPLKLPDSFDLAISVEVAEHLPSARAQGFVTDLAALAPTILFSAAIPGQGGTGHLNEQWPEYWKGLFLERGFELLDCIRPLVWNDSRVDWWYRQNLFLLVSRDTRFASDPEHREFPLNVIHPELFELKTKFPTMGDVVREIPHALARSINYRVSRHGRCKNH